MARSRRRTGAAQIWGVVGAGTAAWGFATIVCAQTPEPPTPSPEAPAAPAPAQPAPSGDAGKDKPSAKQPIPERDRYIEVPIIGEIGRDVLAKGLADALTPAKKRGVGHVVLVFDSRSGNLADALAMCGVLDGFAHDFELHAIVKGRVQDGALLLLAMCHDIHVVPGAADVPVMSFSGGVAAPTPGTGTRAIGALAADLGTRAERAGHPGLLFRALVSKEVEVYQVTDERGKIEYRGAKPESGAFELIDGPETLLTLSAAAMIKLGLAEPMAAPDAAILGKTIGLENWVKSQSPAGVTMMKHAANELESMLGERSRRSTRIGRIAESIKEMPEVIESARSAAQRAEPESSGLRYAPETGMMTEESRRIWWDRVDRAIRAWRTMQDRLKELDQLQKDYDAAVDKLNRQEADIAKFRRLAEMPLPMMPDTPQAGINKDAEWRGAQAEITRLQQQRNRLRP